MGICVTFGRLAVARVVGVTVGLTTVGLDGCSPVSQVHESQPTARRTADATAAHQRGRQAAATQEVGAGDLRAKLEQLLRMHVLDPSTGRHRDNFVVFATYAS